MGPFENTAELGDCIKSFYQMPLASFDQNSYEYDDYDDEMMDIDDSIIYLGEIGKTHFTFERLS